MLLGQGRHGITCPPGVNPRWFAPEIIGQSQSLSKPSDIWSFGMLALELMTGEQPYSYIRRDVTVSLAVTSGKLPEHPGHSAESNGLCTELWSTMQRCWQIRPEDRLSMTEIRLCLENIQARNVYASINSGGTCNLVCIFCLVLIGDQNQGLL
jgi:serine/threonine protein kinase